MSRTSNRGRSRWGYAWNAGIVLIALGLSVSRAGGATARGDYEPHKRDVILITVDTLRADRLGIAGHDIHTPYIDWLLSRGTYFPQATVPFPRTTPALASMLTGLWPHHHGSREVGAPMKRGRSLAGILRQHGYRTLGISANPNAGPRQNLARGFDHFVARGAMGPNPAGNVTRRALKLVRKHADPKRPMMLWVHYIDPHWPYSPPKSWMGQAAKGPKCRELRRSHPTKFVLGNVNGMAQDALADCKALYDAEVTYTDAQIGHLVAGLRHHGRFEDALVVFTADHGENLGERGLYYEHGPNVHDASLRVPLGISGPGLSEGAVDRRVARIEDLKPTLLSLVGIERAPYPKLDGRSMAWRLDRGFAPPPEPPRVSAAVAESGAALHWPLVQALVSGRTGGRHCINGDRFSLCRRGRGEPRLYDHIEDPRLKNPIGEDHPDAKKRLVRASKVWKPEEARERTVRTPRYKLVGYPELDGSFRYELYDLEGEGAEKDVADAHPEVVRRLKRQLDTWAADLPAFRAEERSREQLDRLRALGYVQ